jgi:hypothetical protein
MEGTVGLLKGLAGILGGGSPRAAPNVIQTSSFKVELPAGWTVNLKTDPVSATGPDGQTLEVSSFAVSGSGSSSELEAVLASLAERLKSTMLRAASNEMFAPGARTSERNLPGGVKFIEAHAKALDSSMVFAQVGLVHARTAAYINGRFRPDGDELRRVLVQLEAAE